MIHVVLDIRHMTNYINFSCYLGVLGLSMTSIIVFEFFCCYMALWRTHLYFETDDLEIKMGFDHGHQLLNYDTVLNLFCPFHGKFQLFLSYLAAFLCNFGTFVGLRQFLPFLSNLQVNLNELTIKYPQSYFSQIFILQIRYFVW